jgi:hypothetical protein
MSHYWTATCLSFEPAFATPLLGEMLAQTPKNPGAKNLGGSEAELPGPKGNYVVSNDAITKIEELVVPNQNRQ